MAKYRKRINSKGKRWVKGQSSSSNPTIQKHRDSAKSRFFSQNLGDTGLTQEAVREHDVLTGNAIAEQMEEDVSSAGGSVSTGSTFKTFASDWSACSNPSFSRFLKVFRGDMELHKNMLAVLAAIADVIKAEGGSESSTEYFAALMTTLEGFRLDEDDEEQLIAVLALLGMGIKTVPASVLRLKFNSASKVFIEILCKYTETDHNIILRSCLTCLSVLLRCQDLAVWSLPLTLQTFDSILSYVTHSKPKIRKAAHHAVSVVLRCSKGDHVKEILSHPAAVATAKFCIQQLEATGALGGSSSTLYILSLLKGNLHEFPKNYIKQSCEAILKMMTLGSSLITTNCLQVFYSLFSARPNLNVMPASLNAQLINALYDYQPSTSDSQTTQAWLLVLQEGFINLSKLDLSVCMLNLPRIFTICSNLWLTNNEGICQSATLTLKSVIDECIALAMSTLENAQKFNLIIEKVFTILQNGLRLQFQNVWKSVLRLLNLMYKVCGKHCSSFLLPYLKTLAELRDADESNYALEIENVIGSAVFSMGPERVLEVVPLQITLKDKKHEFKRSWLLPVLKACIQESTLQCFHDYFMPLATICRNHSLKMRELKDEIGYVTYDHLQVQIWALLPSFCKSPTDVADTFPKLAKVLGITLTNQKDLRHSILQALRRLIISCETNEVNKEVIAKFAKNYLPILFNIYTTKPEGSDEEGIRHATLSTIEVYLKLANKQLVSELFSNMMSKVTSEEVAKDSFLKLSLLDLLRVLAPCLECPNINELLQFTVSKMSTIKSNSEQKKHFRILEEICGAETVGPVEFKKQNTAAVKNILVQYLTKSTAESSRGARLRCFLHLLPYGTTKEELVTIIPEIVSCCKDKNTHCRKSAHTLITEVYAKFDERVRNENSELNQEDTMKMFIEILSAGLAGSNEMVSATLVAFSCLVFKFKDIFTLDLLQKPLEIVNLLVGSSVPKVASTALDFLKIFISIVHKNLIGAFISQIIRSLSSIDSAFKSKFRRKIRDIYDRLSRKFSISTVIELVPKDDLDTLARLKMLRKKSERKKRLKQKAMEKRQSEGEEIEEEDIEAGHFLKSKPKSIEEILAECDSDDEKDFIDDDTKDGGKAKMKKEKSIVIEERQDEIVDFTDISSNRKIIASKSGVIGRDFSSLKKRKSKDLGFKTTSDGKLIIREDSGSDSEDEDPKNSLNKGVESLRIELSDEEEEEKVDVTKNLDALLKDRVMRKRKLSMSDSGDALDPKMKYQAGGLGIHRPLSTKDRIIPRSKSQKPKTPGSEYKAQKAGGDLRKKGKFEPYSYVPLQRTWLNKRKKFKAAGQFKDLVKVKKSKK
nr:PREDICTED: RRP12-like protein [Bemisia tabaci]